MRRADRLFLVIQVLRHKRVATAADIAARLEVSERTVYRYMQDLSRAGVPILAEAGVGYRLLRGFDLPPLMFTIDEVEALVLGARMVREFGDPHLVRAAESVIEKVEAVVPAQLSHRLRQTQLFAHNFHRDAVTDGHLTVLRLAIRDRCRVRFRYTDANGQESIRTVRPLGLAFLSPVWLLAAWCELRDGFRNFRADRVANLERLEAFEHEPGKTMEDFLAVVRAEGTG